MARTHREDLSAQLEGLLVEIDTAVAARMREPRGREGRRRREEPVERQTRLRGAMAAALRWLSRARAS